jgi:branched-chain amino acid transport system substrate-binding protein
MENRMRRARFISLFVAIAFFSLSFDAIAQTIKVGAVVPLTGRYAALGAQVKNGYEIGVQHINAAGGVALGGKKLQIEMTMLDDESDPTKTVARLETWSTRGVVAD